MKEFVLMIAVALLSACGLEQVGVGEHSSSDGIWRGPSYGKHYSGTVYAVALDYPDGYDWRADAQKGRVKCSMVMFADGVPVLKVPVGDVYEVSSDKSRHRLRDGCLYTDYTDGNTTVIKRDGEAVARFEGAEDILCMEVHDGRVHTLSRRAGGGGFLYRVDGTLVLERPDGTVYPHLDEYADSSISVRMGTLTGTDFFADRGPTVQLRIIPVSSVGSFINNEFASGGINQTLHRIMMQLVVDISIVLPGYSTTTTVISEFCIAETIIVGSVPESYYEYYEDMPGT